MPQTRSIIHVSRSQATLEGAGVHLRRAFGFGDTELFDPFLLLDDFRGDDPAHYSKGFPWHPHRGIETITYVTAGQVEHGDSLGNSGVIGPGDVQWMTAGSGIIHQEMPAGDAQGRMYGFQLWANLPAAHKMMEPRYRDVQAADIPVVTLDTGALVRVICGQVAGVRGPAQDIVIEPEYLDVTRAAGRGVHPSHPARAHRVCLYLRGRGAVWRGRRRPAPGQPDAGGLWGWRAGAGRRRGAAACAFCWSAASPCASRSPGTAPS